MKVFLDVEKGPDHGSAYELKVNAYRAVGRSGDWDTTTQFTATGERALDPDDLARVETHLAKKTTADLDAPPNMHFGDFKRGQDILIDDSKISRTHAIFFLGEDGPSVVDLLSTNGTRVNGEKVQDADLDDGDVVNVGKTRFVVRIVS